MCLEILVHDFDCFVLNYGRVVIVAAVSQGVTEVKTMQIEVTVPNEYPPRFEHPVYRAEVHQTRTRPGYRVLQVRAQDPDPVPYNAEVYYRLEAGPESTRALKYLALDGITGEVTLNRTLSDVADAMIAFTVVAEDGGSPVKEDRARVEILVKTISDCLMNVCKHGSCEAREALPGLSLPVRPGLLRRRLRALRPVLREPVQDVRHLRQHQPRRVPLATASPVSPVATVPTSTRACSSLPACLHGGVCESNSSHTSPALCVDGYYGKTCHQYDPCFSSPCMHGARCLNESDEKFKLPMSSGVRR
ncbi:hypothetical protein HPB52_011830 [Rhipicephalus sanguineus]|uniref:Uncharacterized protein n=1 Tax=Rhipicephalus sanguineus TaxID=34632 RepID=A0A9D4T7I6_RHISA|nr:hypothetical protein HPB52_011830 [Rhipicephalus sanguineus]